MNIKYEVVLPSTTELEKIVEDKFRLLRGEDNAGFTE